MSGTAALMARRARCTMPSGDHARLPKGAFRSGRPKRRTAGIPSAATVRQTYTALSTESWDTPGIEATGLSTFCPGHTKRG